MKPHEMSATDAAESIRRGEISAEAMVVDCLERIEVREPDVRAWVHLDPEHAIAQAKAADTKQRARRANWSAARSAGCHQGHLRYLRLP